MTMFICYRCSPSDPCKKEINNGLTITRIFPWQTDTNENEGNCPKIFLQREGRNNHDNNGGRINIRNHSLRYSDSIRSMDVVCNMIPPDKFIIRQDQIDAIKEAVLSLEETANSDPAPMRIEEGDYDDGTKIMRILNLLPGLS